MTDLSPSITVAAPGSARVAYVPSTHRHWGVATFVLRPGVNSDRSSLYLDPPKITFVFIQPPGCPWAGNTGAPAAVPFPLPSGS